MLLLRLVTPLALSFLLASAALAQRTGSLLDISQTGIGSNGFGTSWRGQDVEIDQDAWLTAIRFETGSATTQVDEIRLMTATPGPRILRAETAVVAVSSREVEAILATPYLLRGGQRYTVWFHQTGTPRATTGCDLTRVDPGWRAYHTNVDPTQAPGAGESRTWWGYQFGTNLSLLGYDNYNLTGQPRLGGFIDCTLDARPGDICAVFFALNAADVPLWRFRGPLRLDVARLVPQGFVGVADGRGSFVLDLPVPNQPVLQGVALHSQALYDATFQSGATFSPLDVVVIQ